VTCVSSPKKSRGCSRHAAVRRRVSVGHGKGAQVRERLASAQARQEAPEAGAESAAGRRPASGAGGGSRAGHSRVASRKRPRLARGLEAAGQEHGPVGHRPSGAACLHASARIDADGLVGLGRRCPCSRGSAVGPCGGDVGRVVDRDTVARRRWRLPVRPALCRPAAACRDMRPRRGRRDARRPPSSVGGRLGHSQSRRA
jgi:hypothetical protein